MRGGDREGERKEGSGRTGGKERRAFLPSCPPTLSLLREKAGRELEGEKRREMRGREGVRRME